MITIVRIDLYLVRLPLVHSFETSSHRKSLIEHILVRAEDADGFVGWGECASPSGPYFCEETTETCWLMLAQHLAPALVGLAWETPEQAWTAGERVKGNRFAKAGLDIACWDLWSQRRGVPLAEALGGTAQQVEAGVSLGIEPTVDALLEVVERHAAQGYRRVKLKIKPGWDLEPARAVREAFPAIPLQVDANCGYRPGPDATELFRRLDPLGLLMIEQPFAERELLAHVKLQRELETALCLDESVVDVVSARDALELQACRTVNIKVSRLGGLGPARAVRDVCRDHGIPVWCGGMHEFGVGRAANLAIASLDGFSLPSDISGSDKYYSRDIVEPPILAQEGLVPVPRAAPGLGHAVIFNRLEENTARTASILPDQVGAE